MGDIDLQTMMIHIERIVRPVRAMERTKLQMRLELLEHLQAAWEEERAGGLMEQAAWEAARRRLGVPEELTNELQKSVSWAERLMAPRPLGRGRWRTQQNRRLLLGLNAMRAWQQVLFMLSVHILIFGWLWLMSRNWHGIGDLDWFVLERFWLGMLVFCGTQTALIILSFYVVDAGARASGWGTYAKQGVAVVGIVTAIRGTFLIMGAGPWTDLLWVWVVGVVMTAGLAWMGRFLRPGIRDFGDWLTLDIAA